MGSLRPISTGWAIDILPGEMANLKLKLKGRVEFMRQLSYWQWEDKVIFPLKIDYYYKEVPLRDFIKRDGLTFFNEGFIEACVVTELAVKPEGGEFDPEDRDIFTWVESDIITEADRY